MTQATTEPQTRRQVDTSDLVIKCVGLTKIFKDFWLRNRVKAVDAIDFEVRRGEVFGLLGPNGSGKSTTIKMILGLLNPTAGRIAILGKPPTDVSIKQKIGYLPEESYLYRFLNARETLDYYGRLFHQDRRQRTKRIDMLLEMVGLDKVQRRPVGEYSKGMQRRIGIAQALINDPDLIILDEPTTGLDPIGTRQVKDLVLDLARPRNGKPGKTILLCSHLLADVEDVCDRVSIMFGGRIRQQGTVEELLVQEGRTTIHTPSLPPELIEKVEALLAEHGQHIERVEQPRQKLEELFMDIVKKALAEGASTSGASSGGRTAAFLTEGAPEGSEADQGAAVLDQLVSRTETPEAAPPAAKPDEVARQAQAAETQRVMEQLREKPAPSAAPASLQTPPPATPPAAPPAAPTEQADEGFLNELTGGKARPSDAAPEAGSSDKPKPPKASEPVEEKPDTDFLQSLMDAEQKKNDRGGDR